MVLVIPRFFKLSTRETITTYDVVETEVGQFLVEVVTVGLQLT